MQERWRWHVKWWLEQRDELGCPSNTGFVLVLFQISNLNHSRNKKQDTLIPIPHIIIIMSNYQKAHQEPYPYPPPGNYLNPLSSNFHSFLSSLFSFSKAFLHRLRPSLSSTTARLPATGLLVSAAAIPAAGARALPPAAPTAVPRVPGVFQSRVSSSATTSS